MSRILITGMTGYIGSSLAKSLLESQHQVYALVREPLNETYLTPELKKNVLFLQYDGTGESVLRALTQCQPELVYHLATFYTGAHTLDDCKKMISSNLELGTYLLESMSAAGCEKLIYTTSVTTRWYGDRLYKPLSLYAATKQAFSDIVEFYTDMGSIKAIQLALSDTYGPGDHRKKVLNLIRKAIITNTPIDLSMGTQIYDAVFIDDVVRALVQANNQFDTTTFPHVTYQISSRENYTLRETIDLLLRSNHLSLRANWGGRPEVKREVKDKLRVYQPLPDWQPEVGLEEGLRRYWNSGMEE